MYVAGDPILSIAMMKRNPHRGSGMGSTEREELHQHPVLGHKPSPDDVRATEADIVPNYHALLQSHLKSVTEMEAIYKFKPDLEKKSLMEKCRNVLDII